MKRLISLFTLLFCIVAFSQDLDTQKVIEKVKGFKKTTKEYYVLKEQPEIKHGIYKEYYKKKMIVEGEYRMGEKSGDWTYKGPKGSYLQKGSFLEGKEIGFWEIYEDGKRRFECIYTMNNTLSSYKAYNKEGGVTEEFQYDKSIGVGKGRKIMSTGFVMEYEADSLTKYHGVLKVLYPNGELFQERKYEHGKLYSLSDIYKKNGEIEKKVKFLDGKGVFLNYFPNPLIKGQFKVQSATTYKDSVPFGMYLQYNLEGKLIQSGMRHKNKRIGVWRLWLSKKNKYIEKTYEIDEKRGTIAYWESLANKIKEKKDVPFASIKSQSLLMEHDGKKVSSSKKAFSDAINNYVAENFNTGLAESLNVSKGKDEIFKLAAIFKINTLGEVSDIKVRSKYKILEDEFRRVLSGLPTFIPVFHNDRPVNILFSLPLRFRVKSSSEKDSFVGLESSTKRF
ncbi:toxin-antitoxin system YwqK family antitoxin [Ochrovirga pacifica]|uniref:toxin-antitoxin system YwqK family antitoxin n=1 Tax=Ochrovirga pacifica TaxID=1042376 RepID=UPI0002ED0D53|nr:hypothetical protein [Ochrovirga pacifica]